MRNFASLVLLTLVAPSVFAQAPTPQASGVIAGTLLSADLQQPLRKAPMRLTSAAPPRSSRAATTDADGKFVFANLAPGEYTLVGTKPGYLDMVYGARRPGPATPGTAIVIAAGQKIENLVLRLPRGSVITGTIRDEFGDPAFNVQVRAMRFGYDNGRRTITSSGSATTDDRGMYRIAGLMPGEYLVGAVPRETVSTAFAQAEVLRDRYTQMAAKPGGSNMDPSVVTAPPPAIAGYVPMYYPGTPQGSAAATVRVGPAEEVPGIDIKLQVVETASITGTIASTEGIPQTRLTLIDASMPLSLVGVWFRDMRPDGSFSFHGLVPGPYLVRGFGTPGGQAGMAGGEMWGAADVVADPRSPARVTLQMRRGVSVSGTMALDNITPPPAVAAIRLTFDPIPSVSDWEMAPFIATPDATGRFTTNNVLPGQYRFRVTGLPAGWSIASAVFDEKEAADYHLQIDGSRNLTGGVLKFTSRTTSIAGTITNATGQPTGTHTVIVFPEDRRLWLPQSRRIQAVQAGPDGRYTIRGLPPGEYRMAAVLDPEPGQAFDPEFLTRLYGAAITIALGDGEARTQDFRIK